MSTIFKFMVVLQRDCGDNTQTNPDCLRERATDLLRPAGIEARENRLCELVDGVLVEKTASADCAVRRLRS